MIDDIPDFEGPRTLRYFATLLTIFACLLVLGEILSVFYGFGLLKNITQGFVENPMALLDLAGIVSSFVLIGVMTKYALQFVD